jgi:hypothetical protein
MARNTFPHALQVPGKPILVNDLKITFELLADDVTQFHFLLRAEQEFRGVGSGGLERRTSGLGANGEGTKKEQSEAKSAAHTWLPDHFGVEDNTRFQPSQQLFAEQFHVGAGNIPQLLGQHRKHRCLPSGRALGRLSACLLDSSLS